MSDWVAYDFLEKIKSRPTDYFRRNKQVPLIFAAMGVMHQKIDDLAKYIYESEDINVATGLDLDRFGDYADVARDGMNDENYRIEILNSVLSSSYSGSPWQVMRLAASLTQSSDIEMVEMPFAAFTLHVTGVIFPKTIAQIIDKASASGVKAYVTHDYGTDGFALAGIDRQTGIALKVSDGVGVKLDDDIALGVNRGAYFLSGSYLDSVLSVGGVVGILSANDGYLTANEYYIQIGDGFEKEAIDLNSKLCGVMSR